MSAQIVLHPVMTGQQISEWCTRHRMYVELRFTRPHVGFVEVEAHPASGQQVVAYPALTQELEPWP